MEVNIKSDFHAWSDEALNRMNGEIWLEMLGIPAESGKKNNKKFELEQPSVPMLINKESCEILHSVQMKIIHNVF